MSDRSKNWVVCPACGKKYRWKSELAGKKVRCACGKAMRMPAASSPRSSAGDNSTADLAERKAAGHRLDKVLGETAIERGYDLDLNGELRAARDVKSKRQAPCPECDQLLAQEAVLCVNCGFNRESGRVMETEVG